MASTFHIRPATIAAGDHERLLINLDTQLKWLESIGSAGQWGTKPASTDEARRNKIRDRIERSEAHMDQAYNYNPDWIRAYVMEAEVEPQSLSEEVKHLVNGVQSDGRVRVPVAAMILDAKAPEYVRPVLPEYDDKVPFIFLAYLLSDRRTSAFNKGAGAALIRHGKEEVRKLGVTRFCGDCYAGNDRRLVKYYESQGFKPIGDFKVKEKDDWPCCVYEMGL